MSKNLLALDQASIVSGWAIFDLETEQLVDEGTFSISKSLPIGKRLHEIREKVLELIYQYNIQELALEDIQLQANDNPQTYKILAQVQGVIIELAVSGGLPFEVIPPSTWRAGLHLQSGRGIKREQQKKFAQDYIYKIYKKQVTQDEADALCIGTYYMQKNNSAF